MKTKLFADCVEEQLEIIFMRSDIDSAFTCHCINFYITKSEGGGFTEAFIFIPYILAIPVVGIVFSYLLQYNGVINSILRTIGLENMALDWLGDPNLAFPSVAIVIMWKQIGFGVVLFLARMMSIDKTLYESADVDGATWFQKFYAHLPSADKIDY
mgnify:CR=1 FL=1